MQSLNTHEDVAWRINAIFGAFEFVHCFCCWGGFLVALVVGVVGGLVGCFGLVSLVSAVIRGS